MLLIGMCGSLIARNITNCTWKQTMQVEGGILIEYHFSKKGIRTHNQENIYFGIRIYIRTYVRWYSLFCLTYGPSEGRKFYSTKLYPYPKLYRLFLRIKFYFFQKLLT